MPYIDDYVRENGLNALLGANRRVDVCHTEPTTYAQATATYSVGNKAGVSTSIVDGTPTGRAARVAAITDGLITATSTGTSDDAQYWAVTDTANSRLLATGALAAAQMVTNGNTFTLAAFDAATFYDAA